VEIKNPKTKRHFNKILLKLNNRKDKVVTNIAVTISERKIAILENAGSARQSRKSYLMIFPLNRASKKNAPRITKLKSLIVIFLNKIFFKKINY
jgi:hypothetical protein